MYQPPSITLNLIQGLYIAQNVQNKSQFKGQTCLPSKMQNIKLILGPAPGCSDEHYMCLTEHHAFIIIRLLLLFASFKAPSQLFMPRSILCIFLPCSKIFFIRSHLLVLCCSITHDKNPSSLLSRSLHFNALNPLASHHWSQHGVPWLESLSHHLHTRLVWLLH